MTSVRACRCERAHPALRPPSLATRPLSAALAARRWADAERRGLPLEWWEISSHTEVFIFSYTVTVG